MTSTTSTLELGTKPVGKLLLQYAIPAIIAMTAASLYNMIDSIFIGQGVGPIAISGLAITFPFMNLAAAFGAAIGVGASTFISVKLGQKDYSVAQYILGNTMSLNIIVGFVFGIIGLTFLDPILIFFGASTHTLPYARSYMEIILLGNIISHSYFGLNAVLRAAGKPRIAMRTTIFTVLCNTLLDPIFIWVFNLGIRGAAYATILSQLFALLWQIKLFCNKNELLHFKRGIYKLRKDIVKNIISVGISPFSMNVCACLVVILINTSLVKYGNDMMVGAYGIVNRIAFVFVMITMGVNQGMQPIAGYNYGAMRFDRMMRVLKYAILAGTLIMCVGFLFAELLPYYCACLFTTSENLIHESIHAMRISMLLFPVVGFQMVVTNFFQSIGKAKISILLSVSRQMLFLVPLLILLPRYWGIDGVWASIPTADFLAIVLAAVMLSIYIKKIKKQHNEQYYEKQ